MSRAEIKRSPGSYAYAAAAAATIALAACSPSSGSGEAAPAAPSVSPADATGTYTEVQQFGNVNVFSDYRNASGRRDAVIAKGAQVAVRCVVMDGPVEAAPSANGKWYLLVGPGDLTNTFAAANTFVNNSDLTRPLSEQNEVDPAILSDKRICTPTDLSFLPAVSRQG